MADDLSISSQDDTNMSDIDDFASDASDQLDSDVDMESPSETLPAILPSSVGGKGLPVPITAQYFEGVNHDEDEDLDMPETDTIVDDDKDLIGAQYDEDPLDDDLEDDAIVSDAGSAIEDRTDTFSITQPRAPRTKVRTAPVDKFSRSHKRKIKTVAYDPVHISVGEKSAGVDKFLSYRVTSENTEELLVKYKGMSYFHAEWVERSSLEIERGARNRIQKFLSKPSWDHYSEDEPFNPSFTRIDRIIDCGEHDGTIMFLVKWCALSYEHSTWESQQEVELIDADKIAEYYDRNALKPIKRLSYNLIGRSRPACCWVKLEDSPIYKNDNMLRSYQLEGLDWLMFCWYNKQNSILADEMGLGKTVQSTVFLYQLFLQENLRGPFLIVTPLSTIGNWEREIKAWTDMNVVVYHGSQSARNLIVETEYYYRDETGEIVSDMLKFDIVLTTYEMAMSGASQLRPIPWRCVVLDEAHRLKNKSSKVTEILKTYTMEHRVLLTGTPLQNSLDELWALLNFLEPHKFASETDFRLNYASLNSAADVEKLQNVLKPLMLRRLKEDVEKSIPVKEETIVEVELTTTQKKWYRSILEKNFSWLKQGTLKKTNVPNLINTMIELRKCCIHPWLLKGAEDQILDELNARTNEQQFNALIQSSGKMVLIDKLLKKLKQGGHKVLIFSQMTKCLDLIQDYLRSRGWLYERIDGGVRGDLRQASIDRFSAPGSESFVFLLCTRAGGVGINLTAADTCIIFDSDWNPQNDLQAQSRCHRIGQKKPVQIYRLITRNTYEREMFDRASMKLGLDKALLQRMDMQGESGFAGFDAGSSKSSALTTEEVEELLKKGAYGAFMDDEASKQFCEEDIDQILERRTQVIRHDNKDEKSSIFSKATFQASGSAADVDVNDPDFWDKVAKRAELQIVEEIPEELLIMDMPRNRRQVTRFGIKNAYDYSTDNTASSGYPYELPSGATPPPAAKIKDELRPWSLTERTRLERMIMQHGFNNWGVCQESFGRRSIYDLQACCRVMLKHCLNTCTTVDPEVIKDVKRALHCFPHPKTAPDHALTEKELENRTFLLLPSGEEVEPEEIPEIPEDELPYPWANEKQVMEFNSFWNEANKDYIEHIERKAKNMLIRVALMYNIRNKCDPRPDMHIPKFLGAPPAPWWGDSEDKDLMIGICKHGYQQKYNKLWDDPDLCFYETFQRAALGGIILQPDGLEKNGNAVGAEDDGDDNMDTEVADGGLAVKDEADNGNDMDEDNVKDETAVDEDVDISNGAPSVPVDERLSAGKATPLPGETSAQDDTVPFVIPSATDLGVRVRRILNAMSKYRQYLIREIARKEAVKERLRQRDSERLEKQKLREKDFSKKQRHDFQRVLTSFGVPRFPGRSNEIDWSSFKQQAELEKKSDEAMLYYYEKVMKMSREVVEMNNLARKVATDATHPIGTSAVLNTTVAAGSDPLEIDPTDPDVDAGDQDGDAAESTDVADTAVSVAQSKGKLIIDTDGEMLTLEKAKKILKRVELFERLRSGVMDDILLDKKLQAVKRHGKASMPKWWEYSMDRPLLIGINRYGLLRPEPLYLDPELPFLQTFQEYSRSLEERKTFNVPNDELVWGKFEDKFWPREVLIVKRFELLVNYACRPLSKKAALRYRKATEALLAAQNAANAKSLGSDDEFEPVAPPASKVLRLKLKLGSMNDDSPMDGTTSTVASASGTDATSDAYYTDRRNAESANVLPSAIMEDGMQFARSDAVTPKSNSIKSFKPESKGSGSKMSKPKSEGKQSKSDVKRKQQVAHHDHGSTDEDDTDDMLEAASKRIGHKKKKTKHNTDSDAGEILASLRYGAEDELQAFSSSKEHGIAGIKPKKQRKPKGATHALPMSSSSAYGDDFELVEHFTVVSQDMHGFNPATQVSQSAQPSPRMQLSQPAYVQSPGYQYYSQSPQHSNQESLNAQPSTNGHANFSAAMIQEQLYTRPHSGLYEHSTTQPNHTNGIKLIQDENLSTQNGHESI
ncbi:hypothetical protein BATDEDRAFT_35805 [Batrachochytrium dendrobatidis JAM81]|uniref:Chromodomain-helicase-DNA-binding protein 6 n=1 Tax=Batrachochytrium dendrobatidis (strain JAM81 / FGSC 10211) TaxID=684364 RepID=F4P8S6_BATDJ|nr:uncharacterized protein BATDEDRAFT_35805 [Batrachochytrium dendrobatidis JAM81]EGF78368.1 hypothetical protein BATDEDRAFT_35805 [Batrachochytrium dendrobatidis JAM81]|eukprot:XP_006681163.1 hypothetical protein BATDEDRAFT_35805 [Batrachochytrium dendrobatidis JAM81]